MSTFRARLESLLCVSSTLGFSENHMFLSSSVSMKFQTPRSIVRRINMSHKYLNNFNIVPSNRSNEFKTVRLHQARPRRSYIHKYYNSSDDSKQFVIKHKTRIHVADEMCPASGLLTCKYSARYKAVHVVPLSHCCSKKNFSVKSLERTFSEIAQLLINLSCFIETVLALRLSR